MSRTPPPRPQPPVTGRLAAPRPADQWTDEEQAERLQYSSLPSLRGIAGALTFAREELGVAITSHYVRRAVSTHRLARHIIGHTVHFAPRDLYTLIVLESRRTGPAPRREGTAS